MFTKEDFSDIDTVYFSVKSFTGYHIILKSKNTGHIWDIYYRPFPGGHSLVIHHKHKEKDPFHQQPYFHPRTLEEAQDMIKKHDTWQLKGRKEGTR